MPNIITNDALKAFSQSPAAKKVLGAAAVQRIETRARLDKQRVLSTPIFNNNNPGTNATARGKAYYAINKMGYAPSAQDLQAALNHPQGVLGWLSAQASFAPGEFGNFLTWGRMLKRWHQLMADSGVGSGDRNYHQMLRATYAQTLEDEELKHYKALATTTKPALLSWIMCLNNIMSISFPAEEGVVGESLMCQRAHYTYNVIAPNALGKFSDLIRNVAKSSQMLDFLNGAENTYTSPNENYARELLELHTFNVPAGPSTYGPQEIASLALMLTGMRYGSVFRVGARSSQLVGLSEAEKNQRYDAVGAYQYNMYAYDRRLTPRQLTLGKGSLARTWNYPAYTLAQGDAAIDSLLNFVATHPLAGIGICTRIAKWYFGPNPPANVLSDMIATFNNTDGDLRQLYLAVVRGVVNRPMYGSKYKTGEELVASLFRIGNVVNPVGDVFTDAALRVKLRQMKSLAGEMQHLLNNAPTVEGYFNTAERLISPSSMLARMDMMRDVAVNTLAPLFPDSTALYFGTGIQDYLGMIRSPAKAEIDALLNPDRNTPAGDVITAMLLSPAFIQR